MMYLRGFFFNIYFSGIKPGVFGGRKMAGWLFRFRRFGMGPVGLGCVGSVCRVYGYGDCDVLTYGILFSYTFALAAVSGWCSVVISAERLYVQ